MKCVASSSDSDVRSSIASHWPIAVHVIYEQFAVDVALPQSENASERFASNLYSRLTSGDRAARVPVRLWRSHISDGDHRTPHSIPLEKASKNVVVVLVDQAFFQRRSEWDRCIAAVVREARPEKDVVLPFAINADAARVAKAFGDVNHIVVPDPSRLSEDEKVFQAIYLALLRLLLRELPRVFLCHAKADGEGIAKKVRKYLYEHTQVSCFFDMHDIPHGHGVKQSIEEAIATSAILAIWTDKLLDSPWCQFEIIEGRRQQRPMLVLDALTTAAPRLFPFLGNMPVVRWKGDPASIVSAVLLELIRTYHLQAVFDSLSGNRFEDPSFGLHPPDLLDSSFSLGNSRPAHQHVSASAQSPRLFVYPDPPLKPNELHVLSEMLPEKWFLSLVEWQALRAANALHAEWDNTVDQRPNPLRGMRVGVSVSSSDTWAEMGLIGKHQDDLAFDLALQLILLGAKVVWGGDLRPEGFGSQLKWIVQTYQHPSHPPQDHVAMFVPFSLVPERILDSRAIESRRLLADVRLMDSPVRLDSSDRAPIAAGSVEGRALTALSLSLMRSELAKECDARIVLGGGLRAFQGLYPGIIEEAYETVKAKRPLYVLGGYGGAAKTVYDIIANKQPTGRDEFIRLSSEVGAAGCHEVGEAHARYVERIQQPEFVFQPTAVVDSFADLGLNGLSSANGLSMVENECLAHSQDINVILQLIVSGFTNVQNRDSVP